MRKPLKPSAAFSEAERARVTAACERFIDEFLKPRFLPSIRPTEFNYPVDILGKWHGAKYRFIQRYRSGFPENLGEEFDAPFRSPRLDQPRPLRHSVASPHRRMVPPPSRPHSRQSDRNARIRRYPAPRVGRAPTPECAADRRPAAYAEWIQSDGSGSPYELIWIIERGYNRFDRTLIPNLSQSFNRAKKLDRLAVQRPTG